VVHDAVTHTLMDETSLRQYPEAPVRALRRQWWHAQHPQPPPPPHRPQRPAIRSVRAACDPSLIHVTLAPTVERAGAAASFGGAHLNDHNGRRYDPTNGGGGGGEGKGYSAACDRRMVAVVQNVAWTRSSIDYAVTLLRVAIAHLLHQAHGPAERHVCLLGLYRAFPAVVTLRRVWLWQCAVVGVLLVCNGGALYYIVSKAAVRGLSWQVSFLKIALFEWFSEVVLLQSLKVWLFDYGLSWLLRHEVEAVVRRMATASRRPRSPDAAAAATTDEPSVTTGLSAALTHRWPTLSESQLVLQLWSTTMVPASPSVPSRSLRWVAILRYASLETWEKVVSIAATLALAFAVYLVHLVLAGWLAVMALVVVGTVVVGFLFRWWCKRPPRPCPPSEPSQASQEASCVVDAATDAAETGDAGEAAGASRAADTAAVAVAGTAVGATGLAVSWTEVEAASGIIVTSASEDGGVRAAVVVVDEDDDNTSSSSSSLWW
jgi:hypothetical protein